MANTGSYGAESMVGILGRLEVSERLADAQLRELPLSAPELVDVEPQARSRQSDALTHDGLSDLISSIAIIGQLQPIIVEDRGGTSVLLAGERRLTAMRIGAEEMPENPHFLRVRAIVVPGPLSEWERRAVQLAENIARRDLTESDLGRALWFQRCALLIERVRAEGHEPGGDYGTLSNPAERWRALSEWKATVPGLGNIGANWADTVQTLGLELSEDRADEITKAYRDIGDDASEALDHLRASTRARKQVRAAKRAGLGDEVDALVAAVEQLDPNEHNLSRIIEEGAKLLRSHPELEPSVIIARVVETDERDGGEEGEGDELDEQPTPKHSRLADVKSVKTVRSSQVLRMVETLSGMSERFQKGVLDDVHASQKEELDILKDDRKRLVEAIEELAALVSQTQAAVDEFGVVEP